MVYLPIERKRGPAFFAGRKVRYMRDDEYKEVTGSREQGTEQEKTAGSAADEKGTEYDPQGRKDSDDRQDDAKDLTEGHQDASRTEDAGKDENDRYEDVCFICRRPERVTGKMYHLPNHICVCEDCMHKTMDTVSQYDYQGMLDGSQFGFHLRNCQFHGLHVLIVVIICQREGGYTQ